MSASWARANESAAASWRLLYEQDAEGARVSGDKSALIDAVRAAKDIRIYWASGRVEHVTDAHFLTIFGGEVFAQPAEIVGQRLSIAEEAARIDLTDDGRTWTAILSTNGQTPFSIKWFGEE